MHFPQPQYRPAPVTDLALWLFYSQDTQMMAVWPNWIQSLESVCFVRRQAPCPHAAQAARNNHSGRRLLVGSRQSRAGVSSSCCRPHTADFSAVSSPSDSVFRTVLHLLCPKGSQSHPPVLQWELLHPTSTPICPLLPPHRSSSFLNALLLLTSAELRIPSALELGTRAHYASPLTRSVAVSPSSPPKERHVGLTQIYVQGAVRSWLAFFLYIAEGTGAECPWLHLHAHPLLLRCLQALLQSPILPSGELCCTSGLTPRVCLGLLWVWFPLLLGFDTGPASTACWEVGEGQTHHIKYWLVPGYFSSLILHHRTFLIA